MWCWPMGYLVTDWSSTSLSDTYYHTSWSGCSASFHSNILYILKEKPCGLVVCPRVPRIANWINQTFQLMCNMN